MHEMSVATSLLEMARPEAKANGCECLLAVHIHYGQISGIMPEALEMAFKALTAETQDAGAKLILKRLPLRLRCPFCQHIFAPGESSGIFQPCPSCGEEFGCIVEQSRELSLARIEAE